MKKQFDEWIEVSDLMQRAQRKKFDYQERWHGWRSPVGQSMGFAFLGLGLLFIGLAVAAVN